MAEQSETGQKASSQFERVIESLNIGLGEIEKAGAEQIVRVFKRFGWSGAPSSQSHHSPKPEETLAEEGIVFTKNNVLLKANGRAPGYVFVRAQETVALGLVLILNWLPNAEFFGRESASHSKTLSIDSSKVEEIRVFFSGSTSPPGDIGHVIVRGLNDTVHVFEFISGGLAGFMKVLQDCTYLKESSHDQSDIALHTFTVSYPQLSLPELHPGQAEVRSMLTVDHWSQLKHTDGSLTDPSFVQNVVFFKGICPELRSSVWPYLLSVYGWRTNSQECQTKTQEMKKKFEELQAVVLTEMLSGSSSFLAVSDSMEKDVLRADLSSKLFVKKDEVRENLRTLVLCYLVHNRKVVYSQGMSDLAVPLLSVVKDIPVAFWCYVNLLEKHALFMSSRAAQAIEEQIKSLLHLIKFLLPSFHDYVTSIEGGHHLIFTHRWLLVNFKREFSIEDTLRIWETCWACSECNSFHLLVCLAIIAMYGNKPIIQNMSSDELMIHFAGLAHSMSVDVVLSQARGLLHTLCTSKTPLPQDLSDLMITDLSHEALMDIV